MKTLERQLAEYGDYQRQLHGPISPNEVQAASELEKAGPSVLVATPASRQLRGPLIALAVAAVAVIAAGLLVLLGPTTSAPPIDEPPAVPQPSPPVSSIPVEPDSGAGVRPRLTYGVAPIVSNGSSFLALSRSDDSRVLMRSIDGVTWDKVEPPSRIDDLTDLVAVGGFYLMPTPSGRCLPGMPCDLWVSNNGLEWELADSVLDSEFELINHKWRVESLETILTTRPQQSNGLDAFYSVVMEYDDRLVQYRTEYPQYPVPGSSFVGVESADGVTWSEIDPLPPFSAVLTDEYLDAGWQWMWRCEVAVRDSQGMMLVSGEDGQNLWATQDGITWRRLPDPPEQVDGTERHRCIKAVDEGWIFAPGGLIVERPGLVRPVTGTPADVLFSPDAITWSPVPFPDEIADAAGRVEVAGDTIFIIDHETSELLVVLPLSP